MLFASAAEARRRGLVAADRDVAAVSEPPSAAACIDALRLEALAAFVPLLAGAALLGAGVTAVTAWGRVPPFVLAGWLVLLVASATLLVGRSRRDGGLWTGRATPWRVTAWSAIVTASFAAIWVALPATLFAGLPEGARAALMVTDSALAGGALAMAIGPASAIAWSGTLLGGLALAVIAAGGPQRMPMLLALFVQSAAIVAIVMRTARLARRHADRASARFAETATAAQLVRDYEERGTSCLWQTGPDNAVRYITPAIGVMLGRSSATLIGLPLPALAGGSEALGAALLSRAPFAGVEIELARAGEPPRTVSFSGTPILDAAGAFAGYRGACADVTEARNSERRLRQLASIDVLTGLPNRMRMRELCAGALADARESGRPCALLMLDLDGFKPVNDSFGHPAGDALLKTMATTLVAAVGEAGVVGRIGGDEFAVILRDEHGHETLSALADRLIAAAAAPIPLDQGQARVGLSIGVASAPRDGDTVDELVKRADLALYEAKAAGRGTWRRFEPAMEAVAEDRLRTEQDLRRALPLGQLRLCYQPVIRVADRRVVAFEALVRWHHPTRGVLAPADFLAIAEETGLIDEIGDWVLRTAIADCARLPDPIAVAVNLAPSQVRSPHLPARVADALARAKLPANRLELEVDERVFAGDATLPLDVLRRLRARGVRIALDDFGTGRSSLGALNRAVFTRLKIDGSFVRDAGAREEAMAIVRAIVALADCLGMTITAEGIETADDYARMARLGCHRMQGYLLGRPVPFEHAVTQTSAVLPPAPRAVNA
jgi:diguanylate cyclase (GGDEF)-like protein